MPRFRWTSHLSINLFWLALNIRNNAVGALFMPYLVDVFVRQDIKNTALGGLRFAGLIVAMLVQPAMGILSDRSASRFGRRRPFLAIGVLFDLLFLGAIYLATSFSGLVLAILLIQISSNISHGPLQALIPDLVPEDQRGISSAVKAIFELVPLILVGFLIAPIVGSGHLDWAMLVTGGSMLVILLPTLIFVREQPLKAKPNAPFGPPMLRVLGMLVGLLAGLAGGLAGGALAGGLSGLVAWPIFGDRSARIVAVSLGGLVAMVLAVGGGVWAGVRVTLGKENASGSQSRAPFTWWVINRLLFLAAITSIQGFAPYFLMYAFNIDRDAATSLTGSLMMMVGIFTLITALPGGWLSNRFGLKRVIAWSGIAAALGSFLLLLTIWLPSLALIYTVGAILGLATGLFMTANWALGTDLVPAEEAGRYLGVSNLAGAGAGMIGSGMGGPIADYLNSFTPGMGYFVLFACYGVLFVLSAASLRGIQAGPRIVSQVPASPAVEVPE